MRDQLKQWIPRSVVRFVRKGQAVLAGLSVPRTRRCFDRSTRSNEWLGRDALEALDRCSSPVPDYGYDSAALKLRGQWRAREILGLPGATSAVNFLELGCWDGMVSACLQERGKRVTAVDRTDEGFDPRAKAAGVRMVRTDATSRLLEDESVDFVFSYDAFEHFEDPAAVSRNIVRILKPGGSCFLSFGPVFPSAFGAHAFESVPVPYCQFLFPETLLCEFIQEKGRPPADFSTLNRWTGDGFRTLFNEKMRDCRVLQYREIPDYSGLSLIRAYPGCFRGKISGFDELLVSTIEVLFRKGGGRE